MFLDFLNPQKRRNKAFLEACIELNSEKALALLEKGADVNCYDDNGNTALMIQVYKGDERIDFVRFLLSHGADTNLPFSAGEHQGITPIHTACAVGANECLAALLENFASVHSPTPDDSVAIHTAAIGGNATTVKLLLKAGANINAINKKNRTALHNALIKNNISVAKALIKAGADLEVRDDEDCTVLFKSVNESNLQFTKLLLENGANPNVRIQPSDVVLYPLQIAVLNGNLKLVQMLVEAGCKVEKKYPGTFTLLEVAELKGYSKIVSYLKENVKLILPEVQETKLKEMKEPSPGMVRFRVTDEGRLQKVS